MNSEFNSYEARDLSETKGENRSGFPGVRQISILYSVSVIVLVFLGARVQRNEFYSGILISEFVLILLPPLVLTLFGRYSLKKTLRLKMPRLSSLLVITLIMVLAIPSINALNQLYLLLLKMIFGSVRFNSVPGATTPEGLLVNIGVIAVSAGICEEVLFRGVIMRGLERFGPRRAVILSAFLFALWHMYLTSFLGTFLLGLLIGYFVYRTDSLISGMYAHFANNAFAVVASYAANYILERNSDLANLETMAGSIDEYFDNLLQGPGATLAFVVFSLVLTVVFFGSLLTVLLAVFRHMTQKTAETQERQEFSADRKGLMWLIPGLVLIAFFYLAEVLTLMNMRFPWMDAVLAFLGVI